MTDVRDFLNVLTDTLKDAFEIILDDSIIDRVILQTFVERIQTTIHDVNTLLDQTDRVFMTNFILVEFLITFFTLCKRLYLNVEEKKNDVIDILGQLDTHHVKDIFSLSHNLRVDYDGLINDTLQSALSSRHINHNDFVNIYVNQLTQKYYSLFNSYDSEINLSFTDVYYVAFDDSKIDYDMIDQYPERYANRVDISEYGNMFGLYCVRRGYQQQPNTDVDDPNDLTEVFLQSIRLMINDHDMGYVDIDSEFRTEQTARETIIKYSLMSWVFYQLPIQADIILPIVREYVTYTMNLFDQKP